MAHTGILPLGCLSPVVHKVQTTTGQLLLLCSVCVYVCVHACMQCTILRNGLYVLRIHLLHLIYEQNVAEGACRTAHETQPEEFGSSLN